jgi:hypothetical protein
LYNSSILLTYSPDKNDWETMLAKAGSNVSGHKNFDDKLAKTLDGCIKEFEVELSGVCYIALIKSRLPRRIFNKHRHNIEQ